MNTSYFMTKIRMKGPRGTSEMKAKAQRKRRARGTPVSRPTPKASRTATRTGSRRTSRTASGRTSDEEDRTPAAETIDVMDNNDDGEELEEVVDLTSESAESSVVDLTSNDSVLLVDEGPRNVRGLAAHSYVVSSDEDEDTPSLMSGTTKTSAHTSKLNQGTISCPICLDMYSEIRKSGRLAVSTQCGHVFCSQCLRDSLKSSQTCPMCRKRLTHRQYHPLYI